jgi:hypothetical protein
VVPVTLHFCSKERSDAPSNNDRGRGAGHPRSGPVGYLTGRREVAYANTEACLAFTRSRGVMLPYDQPRYYPPPGYGPPPMYGPAPYGPNGENGR